MAIDPTHPQGSFAAGAVGLSVEADELVTQDLSPDHRALVSLMRSLGPGVLRLGGNSVDYSWWSRRGEQAPTWATSVITESDLENLSRLMSATGWRAVLGVDLAHFDPARAASEAAVAEHILGHRLLGIEVGNEPNDYGHRANKLRASSYSVGDYMKELAAYTTQIRAVVPDVSFYGPDVYAPEWIIPIASDPAAPFVATTLHYYPTSYSVAKGACRGTPVPTALELLSPQIRERESTTLKALVSADELNHRETRISETNTTGSCDTSGGPETSPVFASALWSLDWILRAASAHVAALNFHGYFGRCLPGAFSPICAPSYSAEEHGHVIARPEFYGMLAARQLEGGEFVPVDIEGQGSEGSFTAYATKHPGGEITLAIDNFVPSGELHLLVRVPGYRKARGARLTAASLGSTSYVTFAGASFSATGTMRRASTRIPRAGSAFKVSLHAASAIIVTLSR